jgi:NIPSNAP
MKRRSFLQASVAALSSAAATGAVSKGTESVPSHLFELRCYTLKSDKMPILDEYLDKAFLPSVKRHGIGPVGVFVERGPAEPNKVYVLIVYPSTELFAGLTKRLAADDRHRQSGGAYLAAGAGNPVYSRIDSWLMAPIEGMPKLEKPETAKPRLLNLRIYESHNERAAAKKIEMFNKGELAIFRRVGLTPVFFGETIVGSAMPNLTYMLVFPDDAERAAAWSRFKEDAEWKKLRAIPEYADKEIVSRITNKILVPTSYSEI